MLHTPFSSRAIPIGTAAVNAANYRAQPYRPTSQSLEPLVRIADYGLAHESYYARSDGGNAPYHRRLAGSLDDVWCRAGVAQKLVSVNHQLRNLGLELLVLDGYRTLECQQAIWDFYTESYRRKCPSLAEDEISTLVRVICSEPTPIDFEDPASWPAHSTGAAIDVTLRSIATETVLDMGCGFDDPSLAASTSYLEQKLLALGNAENQLTSDEQQALRHRRLLYWSMVEQEFTNYSREYWHYDWGNQMWRQCLQDLGQTGPEPAAAWYGAVRSPVS